MVLRIARACGILSVKGGKELKQTRTSRHCRDEIPISGEIRWNPDFGQMGIFPLGKVRRVSNGSFDGYSIRVGCRAPE